MDNSQQDFINQLNEQAKPKEKRDLRLPIAAGIVLVLPIILGIASLATTAKTEEEIATSNGAALKFFNYLITGKEEQKELPEYKTDANYYIETAIFTKDAKSYLEHAMQLNTEFINTLNMKDVQDDLKYNILEQSENIKFLDFYVNNPAPNVKSVYDAEKLDNRSFAKKYLNVMNEDWAKTNEIPVVKDYIDKLNEIGSEYADRYIGFYTWSIKYDLYETALKLDAGCPGIACSMKPKVDSDLEQQAVQFYSDLQYNQTLCATVTAITSYEIMEELKDAE